MTERRLPTTLLLISSLITISHSAQAETLPNDPYFDRQAGLRNIGQYGPAAIDIEASAAWDIVRGSHDVKVAIVDSGVDYLHPDLVDNIWSNPGEVGIDERGNDKRTNGVDDDLNGYVDDWRGWDFLDNDNDPMDTDGHGTAAAGIIGAGGNNGIGIAGVNWQVSIIPIKVFDRDRFSDAVKAMRYAASLGAHVVNLSFAGSSNSDQYRDAIEQLRLHGGLAVAAAGNDLSRDIDTNPRYPASIAASNLIAVTCINLRNGEFLRSCNFGRQSVHLAAPATEILTTKPHGEYGTESQSSFATPFVSGIAALVKSKCPNDSAEEIKAKILRTRVVMEILADKVQTEGRPSAFHAVSEPCLR